MQDTTVKSTSRYVTRNPEILQGEPIIAGTRTPVRAIVESWRLGIRPEEIPLHLPHLNLAQVFDALSFFQDNQPEINEYIERNSVPEELVHPPVKAAHSMVESHAYQDWLSAENDIYDELFADELTTR